MGQDTEHPEQPGGEEARALKCYGLGRARSLIAVVAVPSGIGAALYLGRAMRGEQGLPGIDPVVIDEEHGRTSSIPKAADLGDPDVQFNLGVRYANGRGVAQDDAEAVRWYRQAAEQRIALPVSGRSSLAVAGCRFDGAILLLPTCRSRLGCFFTASQVRARPATLVRPC